MTAFCRSCVAALLSLLLSAPSAAQSARVLTLADSLVGAVGGVSVDQFGAVYSADFRDSVWRIQPDGRVEKFADGMYGASGNTLDSQGNLFQSSFGGNFISRIRRSGESEIWVDEGLSGPVGVAFNSNGSLFACNCSANTISRIGPDRIARKFASGALFNCPNGITLGPDNHLYVVNFSDGRMIDVDPEGNVTLFATIPGGGNGHVAFARGDFYVTAFQSHRIYRVSTDGVVDLFAGTGVPGETNGTAAEAAFTFPNGIAAGSQGDRLYINDFINRFPPTLDIPPVPMATIRLLRLPALWEMMADALRSDGVEAMAEVHHAFKSDPSTSSLYTEVELNAFGYSLMGQGQLPAAIRVFELNAEDYPNSANVFDSLGEAYMHADRDEEAIAKYRKSLEINPANQNAKDMIGRIQARD